MVIPWVILQAAMGPIQLHQADDASELSCKNAFVKLAVNHLAWVTLATILTWL